MPYAASVRLDAASAASSDDAPVWIQVAEEGAFEGHWQGPFEFTRATFEAILRNFRTHPSYRKGPDGWGVADVVQFDFHHASEADPTRGDIAVVGAPAQAWALDLDIRDGWSGKSELWALTRYLEPARTYVREGRYRWTSVAVVFDGVDPVTGESIGPVLSSIAFTNTPFIRSLAPITAGWHLDPYDRPKTASDALCALRKVLELPATAGLGDVIAEVAKLRAWSGARGAGAPLGVDVAALIGELRDVFNLPTMASTDEVFAEADKLLARLSEEEASEAAVARSPASSPEPSPPAMAATARSAQESRTMSTSPTDLRTLLAQRLKLGPEEATEARILLALDQGQQAIDILAQLFEALEVPNAQAAAARAAELMKSAATLAKLLPEFEAMRDRLEEVDEQEAQAEVDIAMQAHAMPPSARKSMILHRKSDVDDFRKTYPLPDPRLAHLTQPVHTAAPKPASSPLDRIQAGSGGLRLKPPLQPPPPLGGAGAGPIDLSAFAGANNVERAMNMLRAQGDKRPLHELHATACEIARANRVA